MLGHKRGQVYSLDGFVFLLDPSDFLALYDGYLGAIDGFCSSDVICGNWTVTDLIILDSFF